MPEFQALSGVQGDDSNHSVRIGTCLSASFALFKLASLVYSHLEMSSRDEKLLLDRCRRGDAVAWDELFNQHYDAAARFVFQLGSDFTREDAEEICQEAFLSVIKNLNGFHGQSHFQTWLFRIAANKARDYREKQKAAKRGGGQAPLSLEAQDPETGLTINPPANTAAPDHALLQAEQAGLVHSALEQLEAPCREIIELRYFGELSYEELSAELKLNPKTVSSRLSKCLDRLEAIAHGIFSRGKRPYSRLNSR